MFHDLKQHQPLEPHAIVGFAGYRKSGKSTTSAKVRRVYPRLKRVSLAEPIRQACVHTWGFPYQDWHDRKAEILPGSNPPRTFRQELIDVGMRLRGENEDHWLNLARRDPSNAGEVILIDDVRFLNEARACDVLFWVDVMPGEPAPQDEPELEEVKALATEYIGGDKRLVRILEQFDQGIRRTLGAEVLSSLM